MSSNGQLNAQDAYLNAQDGLYTGPADIGVDSLSITLNKPLLVIGLKLNSFPLKLKEGILGVTAVPL